MSKKQLKLWVFQNAGGTKRRVDKANKMVDAYLKSNIKAWEEQLMAINKGYIDECNKQKKGVEPYRLALPLHEVPAEVYSLLVRELKPMMTKGGKFTIHADFTNIRGLLPIAEIKRQSNKAVAKELVKTK
tara:strand:- start:24017 stop:24406 length:390 start_codon:yes stop_codon:yes gene_type:complete